MIAILPIFRSNKALNPVIASIGLGRKRTVENLTMRKRYDLDGDFFGASLFTTKVSKANLFKKCLIWFQSRWGPPSEMRLAHTRKGVGQPFFIIFNYPQFLMTGIKLKYLFAMTYAWYSKRSREFRRAVSTWVSLKFR